MEINKNNKSVRDQHVGGTPNSYVKNNSAARNAMTSQQLPQALVLDNSHTNQIVSDGMVNYAASVFNIVVPVDCKVLHILHRMVNNEILGTYIWYAELENDASNGCITHGLIEVPVYHSSHVRFGFMYKPTSILENLEEGQILRGGSVLATSPNVKEDGQYGFGREAKFAFVGGLVTHEDGVGMRYGSRYDYQTSSIVETSFSLKENEVLLNLYTDTLGNGSNWVPFPSPGQRVRGDGMVCAIRKLTNRFHPLQSNTLSLKEVDPLNDKTPYILPATEGLDDNGKLATLFATVIDIKVIPNMAKRKNSKLPKELYNFLNRFCETNAHEFYDVVVQLDDKYKRGFGNRIQQTPELELFIDDCLTLSQSKLFPELAKLNGNERVSTFKQINNKLEIDEFFVKITTRSTVVPTVGYKFTDLQGGKFVVSKMIPDDQMYTDQWGRVADFTCAPEAVSNRNNQGQLHEMVTKDSAFHTQRYLRGLLEKGESIDGISAEYKRWVDGLTKEHQNLVNSLSQKQLNDLVLNEIHSERMMIYRPIESEEDGITLLNKLEGTPFYPPRGKLTFKNDKGEPRRTKADIRISTKYIILLEKDGGYFSAVSSPRRGPLGIAAKLSSGDKKMTQHSEQPPRIGESEFRNMMAYMGAEATMTYFSMANNPDNNRVIEYLKQTNANPTDIVLPKYDVYKDGLSRGLEFTHHYLNTFGVTLTNKLENDNE